MPHNKICQIEELYWIKKVNGDTFYPCFARAKHSMIMTRFEGKTNKLIFRLCDEHFYELRDSDGKTMNDSYNTYMLGNVRYTDTERTGYRFRFREGRL